MLPAKHIGVPDICPTCHPLPENWNARQDAIWLHAVSQFVDQSGVDVSAMSRTDLAPMVRSWAMANRVAVLERKLFVATADDRRPPPRFEARSYRFALALMAAVLVCLSLICAGVWRFFA